MGIPSDLYMTIFLSCTCFLAGYKIEDQIFLHVRFFHCQNNDTDAFRKMKRFQEDEPLLRQVVYTAQLSQHFTAQFSSDFAFSFLFSVQKNVNSSNAVEVSIEIKKLSYPGKNLIPDDVINAASILEKIVAVKEKADEVNTGQMRMIKNRLGIGWGVNVISLYAFQVVDNFLDTVNNILDASLDVIIKSQQQQNSSQR